MKKQVVIIHGGETFKTYQDYLKFLKGFVVDFAELQKKRNDWKDTLAEKLGRNFEIIAPKMPNKFNAKYREWKIWFEKFIPHFTANVVLVGHSLGGLFLVKYLSENFSPQKVKGLFLVAIPHDDKGTKYSLADFQLPKNLAKMAKQVPSTFFYHSEDDPFVPLADFKKYQTQLKTAVFRQLKNRGHFNQEKFPELIRDLKGLK